MAIAKLESHEHSNWGSLVFVYQEKDYRFPYYIPTNEIFNHDPELLIRYKCLAVAAMTPVITLIRSIYWLAKSAFLALSEAYRYLDGQKPSQRSWVVFKEAVYDSARAWVYGTLLTGYACSGIFFPYWGRQRYGKLERELNRHSDGPHRNKFYLAICFQRLCLLPKDYPENKNLVANKLEHYLNCIYAIRSAAFSCAFRQLMIELRVLRPASS